MLNEASMEETQMALGAAPGTDPDARLYVTFRMDALEDPVKSLEAGRPIYEDREFVRIMVPGDKDNIIDRVASDIDKRRFARQYASFKQGNAEQLVGTPLTAWPLMSKAMVEEFRYFGIRTVDQLADLRDDVVSQFPRGHEFKRQAAAFLAAAKEAAPMVRLTEELKTRDDTIKSLTETVNALKAKVDAMTVKPEAKKA